MKKTKKSVKKIKEPKKPISIKQYDDDWFYANHFETKTSK